MINPIHNREATTRQQSPRKYSLAWTVVVLVAVSTMVGLLGTVIGMIRAFQALAHAGAPDAVQLSTGISEALINTAGGLVAAISGIVAYNFFTTKVDSFTYMIDEASYDILQTIKVK